MSKTSKERPIKKAPQREEDRWVDVHDDVQMVELGLRQPVLIPRDESVWSKTPSEKRALQKVRYSSKGEARTSSIPTKSIPVWSKLVIYLKKNKTYPKTTISTECWQHEIPSILSKYVVIDKQSSTKDKIFYKNIVMKYSWNGKTYTNDLPFWG